MARARRREHVLVPGTIQTGAIPEPGGRNLPVESEGVDYIRQPLRAKNRWASHNVEMQMGGGGVAGVSQFAENLPSLYVVSGRNSDRSVLQMSIKGERAAAKIEHDMIAIDGLK